MEKREMLLKQLNETISQLFDVYQNMVTPEIYVYEEWTAKDVLGHIVFGMKVLPETSVILSMILSQCP